MKNAVRIMQQLDTKRSFEHIFNILRNHGDAIAAEYMLNDVVERISYGQWAVMAQRAAVTLQKKLSGTPAGAFVGIHFDNSVDWTTVFWGILMAGYNPLLLDFRATEQTLDHLLTESGAVALVTDTAPPRPGVIVMDRAALIRELDQIPSGWQPRWGTYLAYCTSGTTDNSRIYVYDGKAVASNIFHSAPTFEASPFLMYEEGEIRALSFLPYYHIYGFIGLYCLYATCGKTFIYLPDRSPVSIIETCQKLRVTHIHSVPLMWNNIVYKVLAQVKQAPAAKRAVFAVMVNLSLTLQRIFPRWGQRFAFNKLFKSAHAKLLGTTIRCLSWGGAYLSPENVRLLAALGFAIVGGYGMTEAGIICAEPGDKRARRWAGSLGLPIGEVTLLTPEGKRVSHGKGELFVRGDFMHVSRLKGGALIPPLIDEEGWFASGDIVNIDRQGYLTCLGRSKDTIITSSGENVYPDEIEDHFMNIPGVEELTVFGLRRGSGSEKIILLLRVAQEHATERGYRAIAERIHHVNHDLPMVKRVEEVLVSQRPLPVTTSMKTQRGKLIAALLANEWPSFPLAAPEIKTPAAAPRDAASTNADIMDGVRRAFAEILHLDEKTIGDEDHFVNTLGGDSLDAISLANALEKKYRIFMPDSMLLSCTNVREIAFAIQRQLEDGSIDGPHRHEHLREQEPITSFADTREYRDFAAMRDAAPFNPYFSRHDSVVNDTSIVDGKKMLNFASYNYCGLSGRPETIKAGQEALAAFGSSASGSRLLTGDKSLYRELEREIAEWKNTDDSVVLVSGHATNVTFVGNFCDENDLILYDAFSHNSIEQGCRLSKSQSKAFPHNDFAALESVLSAQRKFFRKVLIIVEGVYSMDGDIAPIPEFVRIKKQYGAFLMVDEAHSVGVIGKTGKGVDEYFSLQPDDIDIKMGTLSKGLGSCGGYLAGKKELIEYLHYLLPGFTFSVGITPANAAVALASVRLLRRDHSMIESLHRNITTFVTLAKKHGFDICLAGETAIIPIMVGDELKAFGVCEKMRERNIFVVPAIYPAVPRGQARIRFCVTSDHSEDQIRMTLDTLKELTSS